MSELSDWSRVPNRRFFDSIHSGLASEKTARIFELFYTTKKGGTGLGLPLANRIVEEHGGRVAVASEPGEGATFAIFLPHDGPN